MKLFKHKSLDAYMRARLEAAKEDLHAQDAAVVAGAPENELVQSLVDRHSIAQLVIHEDKMALKGPPEKAGALTLASTPTMP